MRAVFWLMFSLSLIATGIGLAVPATAGRQVAEPLGVEPSEYTNLSSWDGPRPAENTVPGDEYWDERFNLQGVSGPVYEVLAYFHYVCVGGDFHQVGSLAAEHIACWDIYGETWSTFGSGLSGPVYAMARGGDGDLYVGGHFSQAGNTSALNIARWDESAQQWETVGEGVSGPVRALLAVGGYVYAGGQFSQAGAVAANNVARWETSSQTWSALGIGGSNGVSGPVYALAVRTSTYSFHDLFVGGNFTGIGGVSAVNASNIARWNSNTGAWAEVSSSVSGPVYALASCGSTVYVGGEFNQTGTLAVSNIAAWDSGTTAWSTLGRGTNRTVEAIACAGNRVYIGGRFAQAGKVATNRVARWNTTAQSWAALGSGTSGDVFAVAILDLSNDVYVGGSFSSAGSTASRNFAHYTGNYDQSNPDDVNWDRVFCLEGPDDDVSAITTSGDILYYGGRFTSAAGMPANHIARYDTSTKTWSAVGTGVNGDVEVIAVSGGDVYVGGDFSQAGGINATNIARWNSATAEWSALGGGTSGPVLAIAVSGGSVYVGGNFATAGGTTVNHIARWDSATESWSPLGGGTWIGMNAPVHALAVAGDDLYAGGSFSYAQDVRASYVARWDGSTWFPLGGGLNNHVFAIAVQGSGVYVAGTFSTAGGSPAYSVARWDGANWHAMPGLGHPAHAIAFNLGDVYAGGEFSDPGGSVVNGVGRWDGVQWQPLGSGVGQTSAGQGTSALAVGTAGLYVGGSFESLTNGLPCSHTALWHVSTEPPGTGSIGGRVHSGTGTAVAGASVQVCRRAEAECTRLATTDSNGDYQVTGLSDGEYLVQAYPPRGLTVLPASPGPMVITAGSALQADLNLRTISPLPSGIALAPSRRTSAGVPLVHWRQATQLTLQGCNAGRATYQVLQDGNVLTEGTLVESGGGQYSAGVAALHPASGYAQVQVDLACPVLTVAQSPAFDIYIDPSGTVKDVLGLPIPGAQVTLYAYDPLTLSLTQIPAGDAHLSPVSGDNPDLTDIAGHFGWDASAGTYMIRAEKDGCTAPADPNQPYVRTDLVQSPFTMVDLDLRLECAGHTTRVFMPVVIR